MCDWLFGVLLNLNIVLVVLNIHVIYMAQASHLCFGQCDSTTAVFLPDFVMLFNRVYGSCLRGRVIGPYIEFVLRLLVKNIVELFLLLWLNFPRFYICDLVFCSNSWPAFLIDLAFNTPTSVSIATTNSISAIPLSTTSADSSTAEYNSTDRCLTCNG